MASEDCELSEKNFALIEEILMDPIALNWVWTRNHPKPYLLTNLESDSLEYQNVMLRFTLSSGGKTVTKIQRVENPYLLGQYLLKREKLKITEKNLYHGTHLQYIDSICTNNFNWRKCGVSRGHKFGQGVSFAKEASYAKHYTPDGVMIDSKVLVKKVSMGNTLTKVPPESYDTTTNGKGTVYVKYEDDDFYPEYIIHFLRF